MKRFIAFLFASILTTQVWAQQKYDFSAVCESGQTLYYKIGENNTVSITNPIYGWGYGDYDAPTGDLEIPSKVQYGSTTYTVTSIGTQAFQSCVSLSAVSIPTTVTSIGLSAFNSCGISSIDIPESVTELGDYVFASCRSLTNITVNSNNAYFSVSEDGVLFNKDKTIIRCCPAGKTGEYTIPGSVTSIGNSAFYGCQFTSVTIPNNVTKIDDYAFRDCEITTITIPNSVTSIGSWAFEYCSYLNSVTIGEGVTYIGKMAFEGCTAIESLTVPPTVKEIGENAFQNVQNVTYKGYSAGYPWGANNVTTNASDFTFADDEMTILTGYKGTDGVAFIPSTVTSIAEYAFDGCSTMTSVNIPNSVTSIGYEAFMGCNSLESIDIPESVTEIDNYAFNKCSNLKSVIIPNAVINGNGNDLFDGCENLTEYKVHDNNTYYKSVDGVIFSSDGKKLALCPTGKKGQYSIPEGLTTISEGAFVHCNSLTEIIVPKTVTTIERDAFRGCTNLQTIDLTDGLKSIDSWAFVACNSLESIDIPNSVSYIGAAAFDDIVTVNYSGIAEGSPWGAKAHKSDIEYLRDDGTILLLIYNGTDTNVVIPYGVTSIGDNAFLGSNLKSVIIPNSVTSIGNYAFYNCSNLSTNIPKSVTHIGTDAFKGTKVNINQNQIDSQNQEIVDGVIYEVVGDNASVVGYREDASLKVLKIPSTVTINDRDYSVTSIGQNAFAGCQTLESVTIGKSVTSIGIGAFANCHNMRELVIGHSVESIGTKAFFGCHKLNTVTVPEKATVGDDAFFYVKNVDYYGNYSEGAPWGALTLNGIKDDVFIYADAEKTRLTAYIGYESYVEIPEGVTSIGSMAFFESDLMVAIIPNTVKIIGGSAFANCKNLQVVNIPLSVRSIGRGAFRDCGTATQIYCEAYSQPDSWNKEWDYKANKILWGQSFAVGINEESATGVVIYATGRTIVVENATDEIRVYDAMGRLVGRDAINRVRTEIRVKTAGVYIVKTSGTAQRVVAN